MSRHVLNVLHIEDPGKQEFLRSRSLQSLAWKHKSGKIGEGLGEFITSDIWWMKVGGDQLQIFLNTLEWSCCPQFLVSRLAVKHSNLAAGQ